MILLEVFFAWKYKLNLYLYIILKLAETYHVCMIISVKRVILCRRRMFKVTNLFISMFRVTFCLFFIYLWNILQFKWCILRYTSLIQNAHMLVLWINSAFSWHMSYFISCSDATKTNQQMLIDRYHFSQNLTEFSLSLNWISTWFHLKSQLLSSVSFHTNQKQESFLREQKTLDLRHFATSKRTLWQFLHRYGDTLFVFYHWNSLNSH